MAYVPGRSESAPTTGAAVRPPMRIETVRRQFDRRAPRFAHADFLPREAARRLIEHLDEVRLTPQRILDLGCGSGATQRLLVHRYPRARWVGVDLSLPMLTGGRTGAALGDLLMRWRGRGRWRVCADAAALPFTEGSFDLLFSNLMLHWHPAPQAVFAECRRVLAADGLLLFSCFGPDTLRELRAACAETLPAAAPMAFADMHDLGDLLVAAGFAAPVMDMEMLRLTYESPQRLLREVRLLGGNPRDDRAPGLPSGARARALLQALERRRGADGRIALTFEIVYGHAWKPPPRAPREQVVALDRLRAGLPRSRS